MNYIKMTYKGFAFPVNPATIKVALSKRVSKSPVLFLYSRTQETGFQPAVITGNGCFTGEKASESAHALMKLFKEEGSAYLFAPEFYPLKVFFKELKMTASADKSRIDYSFTFVEDCVGKKSRFDFRYTYALEGENLYDVANRTGTPVEEIFSCNDYPDLFSVSKGDKIWLK